MGNFGEKIAYYLFKTIYLIISGFSLIFIFVSHVFLIIEKSKYLA